jgi:hypothetical protein
LVFNSPVSGGPVDALNDATITGTGWAKFLGHVTVTGTVNAVNVTDGGGSVAQGIAPSLLDGSGTLRVSGIYNWNGGSWADSGRTQILASAHLNISSGFTDDISVVSRTLDNYGTVTWSSPQNLNFSSGAAINNNSGSLFDIQVDRGILDGGQAGQFTNSGGALLQKSAGTGTTKFDILYNDQHGQVKVHTGIIETPTKIFKVVSGQLQIDSGAEFLCDAGFEQDGGTSNLDPSATLGVVGVCDISGGTLTLASAALTVNGDLLESGGSISLNGSTVSISGAFDQSGGTINLPWESYVTASGSVTLSGGQFFLTGGQLSTAFVSVLSGGLLEGDGTIIGSVTNAGLIVVDDPQGYPHTLSINGDYTQTQTGTLRLFTEVGGGGVLAVSGSVTLYGTLDISGLAGDSLLITYSALSLDCNVLFPPAGPDWSWYLAYDTPQPGQLSLRNTG